MDSTDSTLTPSNRALPTLAIFRHELRALRGSWLVWTWLVASGVLSLLLMSGGWATLPTSHLVAFIWAPFLVLPWSFVVMVLGISPVTGSRAESLADGILSRPVTRYEYFVACWGARVVTVLAVFLIVTLPFVLMVSFADRPEVVQDPVTLYGAVTAVGVVGLVLTFLVSLGFLVGTLLRNTLFAAMVLIFVWFPADVILSTFKLAEFSPISLNQALPTLLVQTWSDTDESEEIDAATAYDEFAQSFGMIFTGGKRAPEPEEKFYGQEAYEEVSLLRVLLGYGTTAVLSVLLATFLFATRDL